MEDTKKIAGKSQVDCHFPASKCSDQRFTTHCFYIHDYNVCFLAGHLSGAFDEG